MPPSPVSNERDGPRQQREYNPRNRGNRALAEQEKQADEQQPPVKMENNLNILFNQSKDEMFSLTSGYKKFQRELKNFKIFTNRDDITLEKLVANRIFVSIGKILTHFF